MSDSITYRPFNELLKNVVDNRGKTCPTSESGIPLIATNCIKNENLYPVFEKVRYVSQDVFDNWFREHPKPDDIIFVNKGTPGRVCLVPDPVNFCIAQDMVAIRANENEVYPKYLFAALRSPNIQLEIENLHVGSLIPHFKKGDFKALKIPIPNKKLQEFIGDLYFEISLKIEFLQRQNKSLEQLLETFFRQWFLEDAQKEWESVKISNVASINKRAIGKEFSFDEIEYLDTGSITEGRIESFQKYLLSKAPSRAKRLVIENDIVYSLVRPIQKHYGLLHDVKSNTIVSTGFCVISCERITPYFIYILLTQNETVEYFEMIAEGSTSTYPSLKPSDIGNFEFQLPPQSKLEVFHEIAETHWNKMKSNTIQIDRFIQLRNTLIPKLISEEIKISI